jgi:hypothetical protein
VVDLEVDDRVVAMVEVVVVDIVLIVVDDIVIFWVQILRDFFGWSCRCGRGTLRMSGGALLGRGFAP